MKIARINSKRTTSVEIIIEKKLFSIIHNSLDLGAAMIDLILLYALSNENVKPNLKTQVLMHNKNEFPITQYVRSVV